MGLPVVKAEPPRTIDPLVRDHGRYDYADSFEVQLPAPDDRSAECWARAALEGSPAALRWLILFAHRRVLRFRLQLCRENVLGWRITESTEDVTMLCASGTLMAGVIIGRRPTPDATMLQTYLYFHKARTARLIWIVVRPIHQGVASYLLRRTATAP